MPTQPTSNSSMVAVAFLLLLMGFAPVATAVEYYVSSNGSDLSSGLTARDAWRSVNRVNRHLREHGLKPGDSIRFRGGDTFRGSLVVEQAGGGNRTNPAWITTYGRGRVTVLPGIETGLLIRETPWLIVSNLVFKGAVQGNGDGIRADRILETGQPIPGIIITDCEAHGFAWHGIMIDASQRSRGYEDVHIRRCLTTGNRHAGIMVYGGNPTGRDWRPHARITIADCIARENPGDPDELRHHSGSGILLDGVDTGGIYRCIATGNGRECRNARGGPVGIWTHASRGIVIEHCESMGNQSSLQDGGGFDIDAGCENCVMRHNFSHHNHGPGFLVYTYSGSAYADRSNRVHGNISWNDGSASTGYAGIQIGSEPGCRIQNLEVFHNIVVAPGHSVAALKVMGHSIQGVISSNVVVGARHGALVSASGYDHSIVFSGNHYWRPGGVPVFLVDFQWVVPELAAWRNATGPDHRFTAVNERFSDPGLTVRAPSGRWKTRTTPEWPVYVSQIPLPWVESNERSASPSGGYGR